MFNAFTEALVFHLLKGEEKTAGWPAGLATKPTALPTSHYYRLARLGLSRIGHLSSIFYLPKEGEVGNAPLMTCRTHKCHLWCGPS